MSAALDDLDEHTTLTERTVSLAFVAFDREHRIERANAAFATLLGYDSSECVVGLHARDIIADVAIEVLLDRNDPVTVSCRARMRDGSLRWVKLNLESRSATVDFDYRSELRDAREGNRLMHAVLDEMGVGVYVKDEAGRYVNLNSVAARFIGRPTAEIIGRTDFELLSDKAATRNRETDERVMSTHTARTYEESVQVGSRTRTYSLTKSPWHNRDRRVIGVFGVRRDVTAERAEARKRKASDERFRQLAESMDVVFWITSTQSPLEIIYANQAFEALWGRSLTELNDDPQLFLQGIPQPDREQLIADLSTKRPFEREHGVVGRDGRTRWVRTRAFEVEGQSGRMAGFSEDITERRQTEQTLQETEAQLLQSQKMDAMGRLAGGFAHDFNNLLAVITSYSQLALGTLPPEDPLYQDIEEINKAAYRSAALVRQLLAFSRKQSARPQTIDLIEVTAEMEKMLRRVIGEDVELTRRTTAAAGLVHADRGHIEQILMNLVVNARHAMEDGGRITLSVDDAELDARTAKARDCTSGAYVRLEVADTGCGMDEATLAHIFEPFFTTKVEGKGTGLGLSTVYGLVKQSGGHIIVRSAIGRGTTFQIFWPQVQEDDFEVEEAKNEPTSLSGTETVLLVEDEVPLRQLTRRILESSGYNVLEATSSGDALLIVEERGDEIDMLLTDVVMPRMDGPALAARIRAKHPSMAVVFVSGYPSDGAPQDYLQKPFTPSALLCRLREVLDARDDPEDS